MRRGPAVARPPDSAPRACRAMRWGRKHRAKRSRLTTRSLRRTLRRRRRGEPARGVRVADTRSCPAKTVRLDTRYFEGGRRVGLAAQGLRTLRGLAVAMRLLANLSCGTDASGCRAGVWPRAAGPATHRDRGIGCRRGECAGRCIGQRRAGDRTPDERTRDRVATEQPVRRRQLDRRHAARGEAGGGGTGGAQAGSVHLCDRRPAAGDCRRRTGARSTRPRKPRTARGRSPRFVHRRPHGVHAGARHGACACAAAARPAGGVSGLRRQHADARGLPLARHRRERQWLGGQSELRRMIGKGFAEPGISMALPAARPAPGLAAPAAGRAGPSHDPRQAAARRSSPADQAASPGRPGWRPATG